MSILDGIQSVAVLYNCNIKFKKKILTLKTPLLIMYTYCELEPYLYTDSPLVKFKDFVSKYND